LRGLEIIEGWGERLCFLSGFLGFVVHVMNHVVLGSSNVYMLSSHLVTLQATFHCMFYSSVSAPISKTIIWVEIRKAAQGLLDL